MRGVFIVWDRLFGTFEPERADDRPRYGIVHAPGLVQPGQGGAFMSGSASPRPSLCTVAGEAWLSLARTRLESRRQP
jgi:hypothetical protein